MSTIEKVDWQEKYSVDIEEIDDHQKKMFELLNQLIDIKQSGADTKECIHMVTQINDCSRLYFSTEEKYLRKKGYPDFKAHAKAHRQFTKRSISLRREISEDLRNLTDDVIMELRNWLINHIVTFDSLYVPFLRINRFIEQSKHKN